MVLGSLINHPELLNRDTLYELRSIVARYPYFQTARLLMLQNMYLLHEPDFGAELRRSVLYVADRRALCYLIEGNTDRVIDDEQVEMEEPSVDRTLSLIDAFLETRPEPTEAKLQIDVAGDYVSRFLTGDAEDEIENLGTLCYEIKALTDSASEVKETLDEHFQEQETQPTEEKASEETSSTEESLDESCFTETLAKIYIKQRKYSRALEIIRSLYLKYPEKNIYFADQIRFLEKLIINSNSK